MTLLLRDEPGVVERYRTAHASVWPEVVAALRGAGVLDMRIFLRGRRLFMYAAVPDGFDPVVEWPRLAEDPVYARWDEEMRLLQERAPEAGPDDWWAEMELVFDLAW